MWPNVGIQYICVMNAWHWEGNIEGPPTKTSFVVHTSDAPMSKKDLFLFLPP